MSSKIKICFYDSNAIQLISDSYHPSGGAAKQVLAWIKGLSLLGNTVILMGSHDNPDLYKDNNSILISYNEKKGVKILRYLYIRIPGLFITLKKAKCDYVYYGVPGHFTGLLALITKTVRKKFILRISNDYLVDHRYMDQTDSFRKFFYSIAFRLSDYILCQNDYQLKQVSKIYPDKCFLLKNPFIGEIQKSFIPLNKRLYIAWIGIIQHQKNIPFLYDIASEMTEVNFKISGNISSKLSDSELKALDLLKKLPNVELLGFINADEVIELLKSATFLLNTSHYEGFSNTFLEAFSVGTPVLTLEHNDPGGIIADKKLGFIFQNVDELKAIYSNETSLAENYSILAQNCINYMKNEHELHVQCQQLNEILSRKE